LKTNQDIKRGVSLYSYQDHFYLGKLDLEDCIAAVAGCDAEGFEVAPEMMIPEFPTISDAFVDKWHGWMQRYDVTPAVITSFADRAMHKYKNLTDDEVYERSILFIKAASKLGCRFIRLLHSHHGGGHDLSPYDLVNPQIAERLLPVAAHYNVIMTLECHSPTSIDDPCHLPYLEAVERTGIRNMGLQPDMSSFQTKDSDASVGFHIRRGGQPEIIHYISEMSSRKRRGEPVDILGIKEKILMMGANDVDLRYFARQVEYMPAATKLSTLKDYASSLVYIHAKFNWANEDGSIDEIDYPGVIKALQEGGYKGFINSEFEGNRFLNDLGDVDEIEQVRRQHLLFKNCLGY
jgi:sugar phosphate isomerase/epimerase